MLACAWTLGKVTLFQCTNEEFSKQTNKNTLNIPTLKSLQPICIFLPQLWVNIFINSLQQKQIFVKSQGFFSLMRKANINHN